MVIRHVLRSVNRCPKNVAAHGAALDQSCASVTVKNCPSREFVADKEQDGLPDIARCTDAADRNARGRTFVHRSPSILRHAVPIGSSNQTRRYCGTDAMKLQAFFAEVEEFDHLIVALGGGSAIGAAIELCRAGAEVVVEAGSHLCFIEVLKRARPMPEVPPMTTAFCSSSISFSMLTESSRRYSDKIDDDGTVRQNYIVQSVSWLVFGLSKRTPASTW